MVVSDEKGRFLTYGALEGGKHFLPSDYYPYSRQLLKTAVPSVFDFPMMHLQKVTKCRRELIRREPDIIINKNIETHTTSE